MTTPRSAADALTLLIGSGSRSDPVALFPSATLATTAPAPTMIDVPSGAVQVQFLFVYAAASGSTGGQADHVVFLRIAGVDCQFVDSDGTFDVGGVTAVASATSRYTYAPYPCAGLAKVGVAPFEGGDTSHPGTLTVTAVFIS